MRARRGRADLVLVFLRFLTCGVLFIPVTLILGWWNDRPASVSDGQQHARPPVAWVALALHVLGCLAAGVLSGIWGMAWAVWAGTAYARRINASGPWPRRIRPKTVWAEVRQNRGALWTIVAAAVTSLVAPLGLVIAQVQALSTLGLALYGTGAAAAPMTLGAIVLATNRALALFVAYNDQWEVLARATCHAFGVHRHVLEDEGHLAVLDDGSLVIEPVPPAFASRLIDRHKLEESIAAVLPHLTLHPDSNPHEIWLIPVGDDLRYRRAALQATGGALGAVVPSPTASAQHWAAHGTPRSSDAITLSLTEEDLV